MSTQTTLKSANFTGAGLPNVMPFISIADADFAYDFRYRDTMLNDMTGKTSLSLMRGKQSADNTSITFADDSTVGLITADKMGMTLDTLGAAFISYTPVALQIDGSVKLTAYVVGGYSGNAFPPANQYTAGTPNTPSICNLYDYGNRLNPIGGFMIQRSGNAGTASPTFGGRVRAGSPNIGAQTISGGDTKRCAIFLTFDGVYFSVFNATTGFKQTVKASDIGVTSAVPVLDTIRAGVAFGCTGATSNGGLAPTIYQIAQWKRVLSATEMTNQYARTKSAFSSVGV